MSDDDMAIEWAHDLLDIEKMLHLTEACDKDCKSCTAVERMDCHLEMREVVHSMLVLLKNAVLVSIETTGMEKKATKDEKIGII